MFGRKKKRRSHCARASLRSSFENLSRFRDFCLHNYRTTPKVLFFYFLESEILLIWLFQWSQKSQKRIFWKSVCSCCSFWWRHKMKKTRMLMLARWIDEEVEMELQEARKKREGEKRGSPVISIQKSAYFFPGMKESVRGYSFGGNVESRDHDQYESWKEGLLFGWFGFSEWEAEGMVIYIYGGKEHQRRAEWTFDWRFREQCGLFSSFSWKLPRWMFRMEIAFCGWNRHPQSSFHHYACRRTRVRIGWQILPIIRLSDDSVSGVNCFNRLRQTVLMTMMMILHESWRIITMTLFGFS